MQVNRAIDGWPCLLTVNTASERTIVRTDMVSGQRLPLTGKTLCDMTGHCTTLDRPVEVTMTVGDTQLSMPVYIADTEEQCILVLDCLADSGTRVDLSARMLQFPGREVPLFEQADSARVIVAKNTHILLSLKLW